jgi:NAD(P)-dependent dehydrogenase (short-subunit alcohol dehydrogenase family)
VSLTLTASCGSARILTSGAGSGIGAAAVKCFASAGARTIYAADLRAPAHDIEGYEGKVVGVVCDITKEDQMEALVRRVIKEEGRLDWFVSKQRVNDRRQWADV